MVNSTLLTQNSATTSSDLEITPSTNDQVLYIIDHEIHLSNEFSRQGLDFTCVSFENALTTIKEMKPGAILISSDFRAQYGRFLNKLKQYADQHAVPFILYSQVLNKRAQRMTRKYGFDDYYCGSLSPSFFKKVQIITKLKEYKSRGGKLNYLENYKKLQSLKTWPIRRAVDIAVSGTILLLLLPLLLLIAVIIKLESKGPVFYISKRAGNNYRIFNFYKFRSMVADADSKVDAMASNNQYKNGVFFKIKNDPRVTKFGAFLRKTSLDEIPQLINVFKGDMSLVGNRPLPLYEAEQLTKDEIALRFLAPAGITGLWQITQRGKDNVTDEERIQLDLKYAKKWSLIYDLKILFGTFPALLQKESV